MPSVALAVDILIPEGEAHPQAQDHPERVASWHFEGVGSTLNFEVPGDVWKSIRLKNLPKESWGGRVSGSGTEESPQEFSSILSEMLRDINENAGSVPTRRGLCRGMVRWCSPPSVVVSRK